MHDVFGEGVDVAAVDVVVVRYSLGCPDSDHKYVSCEFVTFAILGEVCCHNLLKIFFSQIDRINFNSRSLEFFVFVLAVGVVSFGFSTIHYRLEFLYAFADCVDGVVFLLEICGEIIVELHINVIEVVLSACVLLEIYELIEGSIDGFYCAWGVVLTLLSLTRTVLNLPTECFNKFIESHAVCSCSLLFFFSCDAFLLFDGIFVDDILHNLLNVGRCKLNTFT